LNNTKGEKMEMTKEMWLIVLLVSLSGLTFLVTYFLNKGEEVLKMKTYTLEEELRREIERDLEREERQKLKQQIRKKEMIQL
jgi:hypothetical protein